MKPLYATLRMHFPDTDSVSRDELYHWIGYPRTPTTRASITLARSV